MISPKTSVIISTYNQPKWLEKVLWGFDMQTESDFEIVIADDGSTGETKQMIDFFKSNSKLKITHVWQEDNGFQKTMILNKAVQQAMADYLIFTDGDCIPRNDFIATHLKLRKPNSFLSGGYFKLPEDISRSIMKEDIEHQNCFNVKWLLEKGLKKSFKLNKLSSFGLKERFLNTFTPTKATFDGMNVSAWKDDILKVNGFDERMQYGGEDREIGERLMNLGVKAIQARYSLICVHLHHDRPYKNEVSINFNQSIRKQTKSSRSAYTKFGIVKG